MYEHGDPSERFPVVDLTSEDEGEDRDALDTSWDEDIACKLFGHLNRDLLGPTDDGNVIVISDSEEEEAREDDHADTDVAPSSIRVSSAPSASTTDDNDTPDGVQDHSSGDRSEDEVNTS
jgi:hypothetical protein